MVVCDRCHGLKKCIGIGFIEKECSKCAGLGVFYEEDKSRQESSLESKNDSSDIKISRAHGKHDRRDKNILSQDKDKMHAKKIMAECLNERNES